MFSWPVSGSVSQMRTLASSPAIPRTARAAASWIDAGLVAVTSAAPASRSVRSRPRYSCWRSIRPHMRITDRMNSSAVAPINTGKFCVMPLLAS